MIHSFEIVFLFISFKRLSQEREQIRQMDLAQLTSDTRFTSYLEKAVFKASGAIFSGR